MWVHRKLKIIFFLYIKTMEPKITLKDVPNIEEITYIAPGNFFIMLEEKYKKYGKYGKH